MWLKSPQLSRRRFRTRRVVSGQLLEAQIPGPLARGGGRNRVLYSGFGLR
jgi:hypothetical protein